MSYKSIILIENDVNLRHSIALILQRAGYYVTSTDGIHPALEMLKKGVYHLLISDITLSETNQVLIPKMKEAYPNLPLVVLTDQAPAEVDSVDQQIFTHYLIKPVAPEQLLDSVYILLGRTNTTPNHNRVLFEDRI